MITTTNIIYIFKIQILCYQKKLVNHIPSQVVSVSVVKINSEIDDSDISRGSMTIM